MKFTKPCYCKQATVTFAGDRALVDAVFCSKCLDRAPNEAFIVEADGTYWAINPNQATFQQMDEAFEDEGYYYERFWGLRKLAIDGVNATFWGMKRAFKQDPSALSGPDRKLAEDTGQTLPKKQQVRPIESDRPMSQ